MLKKKYSTKIIHLMKAKKKLCCSCEEEKIIWKREGVEGYCKSCWYQKKPAVKPVYSKLIPAVSKKREALDKAYSILRKKFLAVPENSSCNAKLPDCTGARFEYLTIHHKKGRGKYYLDMESWVTLCLNCHKYVEEHPEHAKKLGFSETRL
jgi:hypothetical protein